jgi:flagellum-specific ATP synthase
MPDIVDAGHGACAQAVRTLLAAHKEVAPLLALGAYRSGSVVEADRAIALWPRLAGYLAQGRDEGGDFAETVASLVALARATS